MLIIILYFEFFGQAIGHQQPELMLSIIENVVVPGTIVMTKDWQIFEQAHLDQGIFTESFITKSSFYWLNIFGYSI